MEDTKLNIGCVKRSLDIGSIGDVNNLRQSSFERVKIYRVPRLKLFTDF